jgi:hypothetical protein
VSDGAVGTGVGHRPWVDHHRAERREQQVDTPSCRFVSREIARELAKKGARVAVHYRTDREAAQETLASLKSPLQNYSWLKHNSVLKKWLSARSALQESPKTSPKHYENDVFGLRTGGTREREGVFQHADKLSTIPDPAIRQPHTKGKQLFWYVTDGNKGTRIVRKLTPL